MCGFYQQNSKVLEFDLEKNLEEIKLNHFISRKENLHRIKKELPRGQFQMTTREVAGALNVSLKRAKTLIDLFIDKGIIQTVSISNKKGVASIYSYVTAAEKETDLETDLETNMETDLETNKYSIINGLQDVKETNSETNLETNPETNLETYKKENINKSIKKELSKKNKTYVSVEQIESIWALYPNKKGKATAIKKIPRLIEEYGYDQVQRAVERYTAEIKKKNTAMQYVKHGDTFFNSGYMDYLDSNFTQEHQLEAEGHNKFGMYEHDSDMDEMERLALERRKRLAEERQQRNNT